MAPESARCEAVVSTCAAAVPVLRTLQIRAAIEPRSHSLWSSLFGRARDRPVTYRERRGREGGSEGWGGNRLQGRMTEGRKENRSAAICEHGWSAIRVSAATRSISD